MHPLTHTESGILLSLKKERNLVLCWMNLEDTILSEISPSQKDKYYTNSTYMK